MHFFPSFAEQASRSLHHQILRIEPNRYSYVIAPERDEIRDRC